MKRKVDTAAAFGGTETTLTVRLPHCVLVGDDGLLGKNKINEAFRVTSYSLPVCVITTIYEYKL